MTPEEAAIRAARQRARANVTALVLGALVILFFLITVAKLGLR